MVISVVVPVYNVQKYLERCIDSLICQTYKDIEIILIDDGSTDNSLEICYQLQQKDKRIKVIHKENGGVSSARNLGLDLMSGDYVFFVDADDWLEKDCLAEMYSHMQDTIDVVSCDFQIVEESGCRYDEFVYPECYGEVTKADCIKDYYESKLYMKTIWGKLFRKELWDKIRFKKLAYSEDTYAMFEIIEKTRNAYLSDKKFYYYLQRAGGASHQTNISYYKDVLVTLEYNYKTAVVKYKDFAERAAQDYIQSAYVLLKLYVKNKEKAEAVRLITKMQQMKQESIKHTEVRSIKLLNLPAMMIYLLLVIKNR